MTAGRSEIFSLRPALMGGWGKGRAGGREGWGLVRGFAGGGCGGGAVRAFVMMAIAETNVSFIIPSWFYRESRSLDIFSSVFFQEETYTKGFPVLQAAQVGLDHPSPT